jgi:spermidine synthase
MGLAFPLATRAYASATAGISRSVGSLYAANTVGSILGSFLAGFVLIPLLGLQRTVLAAVAVNVVVGCALLLLSQSIRKAWRLGTVAFSLAMVTTGAWFLPAWDPVVLTSGLYLFGPMEGGTESVSEQVRRISKYSRVLFHKEGSFDTITVREIGGTKTLLVDGKPDASTLSVDMATQQLLGHVPMCLHPHPDNVLVIGLASGVTLGACSLYPVQQMDCVEISPDMVGATRFFDEVNHNVLDDPRLRLIIADGRNHLALTHRKYDVIISEPSNPWIAGIADLFTVEFFRLCRQRLNEEGLVCIWVQGYSIDWYAFQSVLHAFAEAFPHVTVWESLLASDYLLVGSQRPIVADYREIERRFQSPSIKADLSGIGITSPAELLAHFVLNEKALAQLYDSVPVHTDDNGIVEYSTPRTMFSRTSSMRIAEELHRLWGTGIEDFLARTRSQEQGQETTAHISRLVGARGHLINAMVADNRWQLSTALAEYKAAAELDPNHPELKSLTEKLFRRSQEELSQGHTDKAATMLQEVLEIMPNHAEANYQLGALLYKQGQVRLAVEHYGRAVAAKPDWPGAVNNLAWILATSPDSTIRDGVRAVRLAEQASQAHPTAEMLDTLAAALAETGQFDRAVATARRAADLARSSGQTALLAQIEARITLYQAKKPYHEK